MSFGTVSVLLATGAAMMMEVGTTRVCERNGGVFQLIELYERLLRVTYFRLPTAPTFQGCAPTAPCTSPTFDTESTSRSAFITLPSNDRVSNANIDNLPSGRLPPEELAVILQGARSLDAYSKKSDCFRRAANAIQTRCSDLESDEDERVKAAISMTLCEIATAKHTSPPMECAPFESDSNGMYALHAESSGQCVLALSRSAQYWSSYSGYLREVAQLCFAFQRWNDIDVAKELYKNASIQTMDILRYMADREKHVEQAHEDSRSVVKAMKAVLEQIRASSMTLGSASVVASENLGSLRGEVTFSGATSVKPIQKCSTDLQPARGYRLGCTGTHCSRSHAYCVQDRCRCLWGHQSSWCNPA
ncbi:hypothetical protein DICSQDRAFT_160322 [Dichomitus squalens LYAD-421 SS1]|uniref:uncharacterized protein n=1 Tax=Dichomitus squalens (strain LYAD-421) TaxID=732165 RepID=UPI00044149F1|nr:uncharacterized protein DICSQDRAFT_160322 [Dichomitus squalens LYAD-421 SS1]EJF63810.1 hypothetical protein DICSQDRAFT_160322 [Dichomitus squalens LYAD-421 SS1]